MNPFFEGYPRKNGRAGTRNHPVVLSCMDSMNPIVKAIASQIQGAVPITVLFGRGQAPADTAIMKKTLVGLGCNPNVGGVLVVSLEAEIGDGITDALQKNGQRVDTLIFQEEGNTPNAVHQGVIKLLAIAGRCSEIRRVPVPLSKLTVAMECGGSDALSGLVANHLLGYMADRLIAAGASVVISETSEMIGAEHLLAKRAADKKVSRDIRKLVGGLERRLKRSGIDLRGINPMPDNIRGGITTLEEKALGAIAKGGSKTIRGVLGYAAPIPGPGLYLMDSPSGACESMTGLSASGANLLLFSTGAGHPLGDPIVPTWKICANPAAIRNLAPNIDADASVVLTEEGSLEACAEEFFGDILKVAGGKLTRAELLKQTETAITKTSPSV
jgi:altronate dehydratase large subunit